MKVDKSMLDALRKQNDDQLWASIVALGASKGFTLPKTTPPSAQMQKIRALMENPEKINMAQALRLLNQYKQNG